LRSLPTAALAAASGELATLFRLAGATLPRLPLEVGDEEPADVLPRRPDVGERETEPETLPRRPSGELDAELSGTLPRLAAPYCGEPRRMPAISVADGDCRLPRRPFGTGVACELVLAPREARRLGGISRGTTGT
jgi:hypothetical protein